MGSFFSADGAFFTAVNKIIDTIFLSILWIIFCIPLFTIGASTSALYATANKVLRHDRSYIFRQFWDSFKSSFKQSTIAWLFCVLVIFVLVSDIRIINLLVPNIIGVFFKVFFSVMIFVIGMTMLYIFPYISRFSAPWKSIMMNSFIISLRHIPWTLLVVVLTVAFALLAYLIPFLALVLPALWALLASFVLERIFKKYMSEEDLAKEEKLNSRSY